MLKNIVEPGRSQMTIWLMRVECWTPKAINTYSEYVIFIAFPLNNGRTNAPPRYVIRKFRLLFVLYFVVN